LLVMTSLLEKEGLAGRVQMVYVDPPDGIKYGSNVQPFVNKRDVSDGQDEDLTVEPEMIRAFRDTWELGVSMVGPNAGEVIHEAAMGMRFGATTDDFIELIHVYPTMAEALKIAAIAFYKGPAKLSCCAE
jgi:hypothetical protein